MQNIIAKSNHDIKAGTVESPQVYREEEIYLRQFLPNKWWRCQDRPYDSVSVYAKTCILICSTGLFQPSFQR